MAAVARAQTPQADDLQGRLHALEELVRTLQSEVETLRATVAGTPLPTVVPSAPQQAAAAPGAAAQSGQLPVYSAAQQGSKIFNPDIGMIGNFVSGTGASRGGSETLAPIPFATLQESEASFQAIINPYARAELFLAIGEQGIEVEEGYISFPTLPSGVILKAGKMRANFGRLNAFHNHTLPWIDRPLVM